VRELEEQTGYRAGRLEHLITFQPVPEVADGERIVFVGRDAELAGDPVSSEPIERVECVPIATVPQLIASGQLWNGASALALLYVGDGKLPAVRHRPG